jgi:hypothetical protein
MFEQIYQQTEYANSRVTPLRHYCRNPRCRGKLPEPVNHPHKAFCRKGCYASFFLNRCAVCEKAKPAESTSRRILCRRPQCRTEYRKNPDLYSFKGVGSGLAPNASGNVDSTGVKSGGFDDRPWRTVAGKINPAAARNPTVGAAEAVAAANRTNARYWQKGCRIKYGNSPINITGGYKFPDAPAVDLVPHPAVDLVPHPTVTHSPHLAEIPDDLSIPSFLRRVRS